MTFAQRRNRLTTHFSERIPVVKRRINVRPQKLESTRQYQQTISSPLILHNPRKFNPPDFQAPTKHSWYSISASFVAKLLLTGWKLSPAFGM